MATYYVIGAGGSDSNGGTNDTSDGWATIGKAASTVAAGDTVNVKATGTYAENVTLTTPGGVTTVIRWVGYTSTVGDGGVVTVQPSSGTHVITGSSENYQSWRNFKFDGTNVSGDCYQDLNGDNLIFENCEFANASGDGLQFDNFGLVVNCSFNNNGGRGIWSDQHCFAINTVFYGNGSAAFEFDNGTAINCIFYEQGAGNAAMRGNVISVVGLAVNCTIDGDNAATTYGALFGMSGGFGAIINSIIYDCNIGIDATSGTETLCLNNLMNSNNTDNSNHTDENAQTTAPAFTDEANNDYTLGATSPAIDNAQQPRAS
jgi:hypothetical protein